MPFSEEFNDIYHLGIKDSCEEIGIYCERVDEQIFEGSILARVYNQISKADIIVADMTGKNPNVFYEVGYAHALGKNVILLTQKSDDIPFDLKHYPHIVYNNKIVELKNSLIPRIKWHVDNPNKNASSLASNLMIYANQMLLADNIVKYKYNTKYNFPEIKLLLHNPGNTSFETENFKIGVITNSEFYKSYGSKQVVELPENKWLHLLPKIDSMLPMSWDEVVLTLVGESGGQSQQIILIRVFTELGITDYKLLLIPY